VLCVAVGGRADIWQSPSRWKAHALGDARAPLSGPEGFDDVRAPLASGRIEAEHRPSGGIMRRIITASRRGI